MSENPSQDGRNDVPSGTMRTTPGERANAHTEGLTTRTCKEVDDVATAHRTARQGAA